VVPVGQATSTRAYQLRGAMTPQTAAALFVVSHHTVQYGMLGLSAFAAAAHEHGVPVIVDAASEYDLRGFLAAGADLVCYSAHKFLGGPTAGIVAGRKDLVRSAFLQNRGIGRGMKVGKEGIAGTIAALQAWETRDHVAVRRREYAALQLWRDTLADRPGIAATIVPDPTDNPLDRLQVAIAPEQARITAWDLADRLASGPAPVIVRDHEIEHGFFLMDPCNLHPGEAELVARRLKEELDRAAASNAMIETPLAERSARRVQALLAWPD
jgi:L-seryl-tRNA(Ser) seleniumtransferase